MYFDGLAQGGDRQSPQAEVDKYREGKAFLPKVAQEQLLKTAQQQETFGEFAFGSQKNIPRIFPSAWENTAMTIKAFHRLPELVATVLPRIAKQNKELAAEATQLTAEQATRGEELAKAKTKLEPLQKDYEEQYSQAKEALLQANKQKVLQTILDRAEALDKGSVNEEVAKAQQIVRSRQRLSVFDGSAFKSALKKAARMMGSNTWQDPEVLQEVLVPTDDNPAIKEVFSLMNDDTIIMNRQLALAELKPGENFGQKLHQLLQMADPQLAQPQGDGDTRTTLDPPDHALLRAAAQLAIISQSLRNPENSSIPPDIRQKVARMMDGACSPSRSRVHEVPAVAPLVEPYERTLREVGRLTKQYDLAQEELVALKEVLRQQEQSLQAAEQAWQTQDVNMIATESLSHSPVMRQLVAEWLNTVAELPPELQIAPDQLKQTTSQDVIAMLAGGNVQNERSPAAQMTLAWRNQLGDQIKAATRRNAKQTFDQLQHYARIVLANESLNSLQVKDFQAVAEALNLESVGMSTFTRQNPNLTRAFLNSELRSDIIEQCVSVIKDHGLDQVTAVTFSYSYDRATNQPANSVMAPHQLAPPHAQPGDVVMIAPVTMTSDANPRLLANRATVASPTPDLVGKHLNAVADYVIENQPQLASDTQFMVVYLRPEH